MKKQTLEVYVETIGLDEAIEKAEKLNGLLEKAKTSADELASIESDFILLSDKRKKEALEQFNQSLKILLK